MERQFWLRYQEHDSNACVFLCRAEELLEASRQPALRFRDFKQIHGTPVNSIGYLRHNLVSGSVTVFTEMSSFPSEMTAGFPK